MTALGPAGAVLLGSGGVDPQLSWNVVADVRAALEYPFMVNAFRAGTVVAVLSGLMGWFMVIRRQSFGHTLAVVGFPGAAGAVLIGVSAVYGLFAFAVVAAVLIALVARTGGSGSGAGAAGAYSEESAVTGTVQAFALASGFLFLSLYGGFEGAYALLFGSFLGITAAQVWVLLAVALVVLTVLAAIGRPLLFASVDPAVAAARGVPVRALSIGFLVLLGLAAAEVSQITGTLLVFALLVVPAATAQSVTLRPLPSVAMTVALAVGVTWLALLGGYYSAYPIGFYLTTFAFGPYLAATGWRRYRARAGR